MALIKCSECGKEISDKAAVCVHCGCPVSASKSNFESQEFQQFFGQAFNRNATQPLSVHTQPTGDIVVAFSALLVGSESGSTTHRVFVPELGQDVKFNVPNNVRTGQSIFLPGQGTVGQTGQRGNLYFRVETIQRFGADGAYKPAQQTTPVQQAAPVRQAVSAQPAPPVQSFTPVENLVAALKAYKYNGFSRFCGRIAGVLIFGLIALFTQDAMEEAIIAGLVLFVPAIVFLLVWGHIHPKRHLKKYCRKHGVDVAVQLDSGNMPVCIKLYNAYPSKNMVALIKKWNPAAGEKIERALAEMKNKKK